MEREEFEFKPITEGLGFHKKVLDIKEDQNFMQKSATQSMSSPAMTRSKMPGTAYSSQQQMPQPKAPQHLPLQKIPQQKAPQHMPQQKSRGWAPSLPDLDMLEPEVQSQPQTLTPVAVSWTVGLFDSAMVLGLTLIFSTVVFALTQIEFGDLRFMMETEGGAQLASIVLLIAVFEIYSITCRTFFGKTLGEYAFDFRIGAPHEQQYLLYPLKVALRTFLVAITGFVLLPIISTIVKRDVAGMMSGVSLYAEQR
ncbi:MAG: hypothetical protein SGI74_11560 [Oligoflexia bacterium]|nr:hypothetical protein [Oligoflexia bacterium]